MLLLTTTTFGAAASTWEVGPEDDWCGIIRALPAGGQVLLRPGDYSGPCTIRNGGTADAPIVLRAKDLRQLPRIIFQAETQNVFEVRADHVTIRGLQFGPTLPGVDAIRIYAVSGITIEDCYFSSLGGIAIVANHKHARNIAVRRNQIIGTKATGMYFGCHDGLHCALSDLLIEQNYINGVDSPKGSIGYGVQVKLNSTATIRDNVVVNTKGPGIMVYGARDLLQVSVVERNYIAASKDSAIVLGGGPAIVKNNIAVLSAEAGIALEDYGKRGLLRKIVLAHNTLYGNTTGGIVVPKQGLIDVRIVNNAAHALPGTPAFPIGQPGVMSVGNVDCRMRPCFQAPELGNYSPLSLGLAFFDAYPVMPTEDYFGQRRAMPPIPGAVEAPARAIPLGIKIVDP